MTKQFLLSFGRRKNYNLVCSSYKPHLRSCPKYKRWSRKVNQATLREMSPKERHILRTLLELKVHTLQDMDSLPAGVR